MSKTDIYILMWSGPQDTLRKKGTSCSIVYRVQSLLYKRVENKQYIHRNTYFCMFSKRNTVKIQPKANKNSHQQKEGNRMEKIEKQDYSEYNFHLSDPEKLKTETNGPNFMSSW